MVVLDAAGRVIRPALLWNDARSAQAAVDLIAEVGAEEYARRTGAVPVASFTASRRALRAHSLMSQTRLIDGMARERLSCESPGSSKRFD